MWFIDVEVEQEMSGSPPKKNPGSAPVLECLRLECTWANITCFELIATDWALTQVSQQESSAKQARPLSRCILGDCLREVQLYRVITCSDLGLYIQQGVDVLTVLFLLPNFIISGIPFCHSELLIETQQFSRGIWKLIFFVQGFFQVLLETLLIFDLFFGWL